MTIKVSKFIEAFKSLINKFSYETSPACHQFATGTYKMAR